MLALPRGARVLAAAALRRQAARFSAPPTRPALCPAAFALPDMYPADCTDPVASVVAAIRAGQVTVRGDGHLQLPPGLVWPHGEYGLLFVRKVYAPLFDTVLNKCLPVAPGESADDQRHMVTGQDGIGKSAWA
jgi:hypothetical protein